MLEIAKEKKRGLFIICKDIGEDVLGNLVYNVRNDIINIGVMTVPGYIFKKDLGILVRKL